MPAVEEYGVEPIPRELQTVGARDIFALNFAFFLNPLMYALGALAVTVGGLPFWWAIAAMLLGQLVAYVLLVVAAQPGVDYGLAGQVAMRATFGFWGARALTSPYRMIAATYWFAAQALGAALAIRALVDALAGIELRLVPVAVVLAVAQAALAVLGFDVMRWMVKLVLPISLASVALFVVLFMATADERYASGRVFESPEQSFTWTGFALFVTVIAGASLTFVTNAADFCRYTPTRRQMRVAFIGSAVVAVTVTTFIGAYVAVAAGSAYPYVAATELTGSKVLLAFLLLAVIVQSTSVNQINAYSAGLSLVNAVPRLGRMQATAVAAAVAVLLSALPDLIERAQEWITHLGNVAAPLAGVIVADYLVLHRMRFDVPALFDRGGRYAYVLGVNVAAVVATAVGVLIYYTVSDAMVKVLWGVGVGAIVYVVLARVQAALRARYEPTSVAAPRLIDER